MCRQVVHSALWCTRVKRVKDMAIVKVRVIIDGVRKIGIDVVFLWPFFIAKTILATFIRKQSIPYHTWPF